MNGEYGVKGMYVGVPTVIGAKGVERIVEIKLDATERAMFKKSVKAVQDLMTTTNNLKKAAENTPAKKAPAKKASAKKAPAKKAAAKKSPAKKSAKKSKT